MRKQTQKNVFKPKGTRLTKNRETIGANMFAWTTHSAGMPPLWYYATMNTPYTTLHNDMFGLGLRPGVRSAPGRAATGVGRAGDMG